MGYPHLATPIRPHGKSASGTPGWDTQGVRSQRAQSRPLTPSPTLLAGFVGFPGLTMRLELGGIFECCFVFAAHSENESIGVQNEAYELVEDYTNPLLV